MLAGTSGGTLVAVGAGESGQLGVGIFGHLLLPTVGGDAASAGHAGRDGLNSTSAGNDWISTPLPLLLPARTCIKHVACGWNYTVCLDVLGRVFTCGDGSDGRLGLGDCTNRHSPTLVDTWPSEVLSTSNSRSSTPSSAIETAPAEHLPTIVSIACGEKHVIAIDAGGRVYAWGCARKGVLGVPASQVRSDAVSHSHSSMQQAVSLAAQTKSVDSTLEWRSGVASHLVSKGVGDNPAPSLPATAATAPKSARVVPALDGISTRPMRLHAVEALLLAECDDVAPLSSSPSGARHRQSSSDAASGAAVGNDGCSLPVGQHRHAAAFNEAAANYSRITAADRHLVRDAPVQAVCGWSHSAILTRRGRVITWGSNRHGQCGRDSHADSNDDSSHSVTDVNGRSTAGSSRAEPESETSRSHSATSDSDVARGMARLGGGSINNSGISRRRKIGGDVLAPGFVSSLDVAGYEVTSIAAGWSHMLATAIHRPSSEHPQTFPAPMPSSPPVEANMPYSLPPVIDSNVVLGWGRADYGQLGARLAAVEANRADELDAAASASISSSSAATAAIFSRQPSLDHSSIPLRMPLPTARRQHGGSCSRRGDVDVAVEQSTAGEGSGPTSGAASHAITSIACGAESSYFTLSCGCAFGCGWNEHGNLGTGDTINRFEPTVISMPAPVRQVAAAGAATFLRC